MNILRESEKDPNKIVLSAGLCLAHPTLTVKCLPSCCFGIGFNLCKVNANWTAQWQGAKVSGISVFIIMTLNDDH